MSMLLVFLLSSSEMCSINADGLARNIAGAGDERRSPS